ncbi:MAG: spore coat polysaccharide biosynthesis protein SpsF [Limisphaerales bacterium]|nr:MAG: spore coat polysaccharide biosynthesis protein SpsF [Limisphaerales bacterium]KAG0509823.1 MAG: spore coat polysaccharide biosynthesis protein SpsF [Limisphaerales bacterium]TXT50955.1 MAG: spore coat polysaccharide biosynthesis protein SpsF [Limisphaerales bacterium]
MKSSRLPGKVLLPVCGKPLLELMIERLRQVPELDGIVIATTADPSCQPIEDLAKRLSVGCFRGGEDDVLDRVLRSAQSAQADLIVELTGDCPLIDPDLVSEVIREFRSRDVDYCANVLQRTHPRGMDVQVFPTKVLAQAAELTNNPSDREHVSIYIYTHPERFRLHNVTSSLSPEDADLRLTVDTPDDFKLVSEIFQRLYPTNPRFRLADILKLMREHPELRAINSHVKQKSV